VRKLLIIDDELELCRIMKRTLESTREYEVLFSTNGPEGLQIAELTHPDVILLDVGIPGMSGPEIAERLKALPGTKDIPVIYLTGNFVTEQTDEGAQLIEGNYFLAKPVRRANLVKAIDTVLGKENEDRSSKGHN
jgi:putative two-component system response regulator